MNRLNRSIGLAVALLLVASSGVLAQETNHDDVSLGKPGELNWQPGPASIPEGASFAVIEGDPSAEGLFTMRLRLPDGYTIPPHWHPEVERVTVIEGTFRIGMSDVIDADALEDLPVGSFIAIPPGHRHFARAQGETVIQLNAIGPWSLNYVNPEHDPRNQDRD